MRISEIMEKSLFTVSPELSIRDFEDALTSEEISGTPVVDSDLRLVGIASKTDIVRSLSESSGQPLSDLFDANLTVEDIMTPDVVTVSPDTDVVEVARKMVDGHLHRIVVVENGELIGIVTALDLLKLMCDPNLAQT